MVRRTTPARKTDDRRFRFRAKFRLPDYASGWPIHKFHEWLDARVGRNGYAIHGADWNVIGTVFAVHFDDATALPEMLQKFEELTSGRAAHLRNVGG